MNRRKYLLFEIQIHHGFEMIEKKFDFPFTKVTESFRCILFLSNRPIDSCIVWAGLLHSLLDIRVQRRTDLSTEHPTGLQQASGKPRDPTQMCRARISYRIKCEVLLSQMKDRPIFNRLPSLFRILPECEVNTS